MARFCIVALLCVSWLSAQALAQPAAEAKPRLADAKRLSEARDALRKAVEALADAQKAVAAAADDESRRDARRKLDVARRELVRLNTAAIDAADQAAISRRVSPQAMYERVSADPQDPVERFALLTPGGPLVVEATLTIDGQPFRLARERLIDGMLAAADKDQDGKTTWDEAVATPRFALGRLRLRPGTSASSYLRSFDTIANGKVDREEARQFLARMFQGPAFMVGGPAGFRGGLVVVNGRVTTGSTGQADILSLLDVDHDGTLDKLEMSAAPQRLASRDADDNDLLEAGEISGNRGVYARPVNFQSQQQPQQRGVLLGPAAGAQYLSLTLIAFYASGREGITQRAFWAMPELFAALDKNGDKELEQEDLYGLNEVPPHVKLTVDLSASGEAKGLSLTALAAPLEQAQELTADSIRLNLPGAKVALAANLAPPRVNYSQSAAALVTRYDANKNGYLEKEEVPGGTAVQFELWDADGDGKAFPAEIEASYEAMAAPQASQIVVSLATAENSLFSSLDANGDLKLGAREMKSAAERIAQLDADGDGRITAEEMPAMIVATFGLGSAGYGGYSAPPAAPRAVSQPAPQWFTRMDRNGDGDLSLKEFLGSGSDFRALDANGDGFLEAKEAAAAK